MSGGIASIDDWIKGHLIPRRDHSPKVDIALRNVRMSVRMGSLPDKGFGTTRDEFNREFPDMLEFGASENTVGDDQCWGGWPHDPNHQEDRGIWGWANAWPTVLDSADGPSDSGGAPGGMTVSKPAPGTTGAKFGQAARPVRNVDWKLDSRFQAKKVSLHPSMGFLPAGMPGIVIAGTEERSQEDLFFPAGSVLVAPWHGGSPELGNFVHDATDANELDLDRRAHLQSLVRVYKVPVTCGDNLFGRPGTRGLAIQMSIARGGFAGRATFGDFPDTDRTEGSRAQALAAGSHHAGGCFHVGAGAGDQHLQGVNADGDWLGPLHFNPKAPWFVNAGQDAPFLFTSDLFEAVEGPGVLREAKLVIDPPSLHPTPCGPKQGYHRWQVRVPVYFPPPTYGGTRPSQDQGITRPASDETFTQPASDETFTDPGKDETFTLPSVDNFLTGSRDNPDADQGFGGGEIPNDGGGIPKQGIPNDGGIPEIPNPDGDGGIPGETIGPLRPLAYDYLVQFEGPAQDGPAGQGARARFGQNLPVVSFVNEVSSPALVFRPQNQTPSVFDLRYSEIWDQDDAARVDENTPAVARLEAIGNQYGEDWTRTTERDLGRYRGGTAIGGIWVFQPEVGAENVFDEDLPEDLSDTIFGIHNGVSFGWGKPTDEGGIADGYSFRQDSETGVVVGYTHDADGVITDSEQLWPPPGSGTPVAGTPKNYCTGFGLSQPDYVGSPSTIDVAAGICRDDTNTYDINVGDPSTDYLSNGGLLFNDALEASDTGITATVNSVVVGGGTFGTAVMGATILPKLIGRPLTGNVDFSAPFLGLSTMTPNVAGTTRFTSELAVGDLVGDSSCDFRMVVSIASDSSAVVASAHNLLGAFTNKACTVYENTQLQIGAIPAAKVCQISGDGLNAWAFSKYNGNVNAAGLGVIVGQPAASIIPVYPAGITYVSWVRLWARTKSDGTSTLSWSTQRTTPFTPATLTGYSYRRKIAVLPLRTDNFVPPFTESDLGGVRLYQYEDDQATAGFFVTSILLGSAGSAAWSRASAQKAVPPESTTFLANVYIGAPSALAIMRLRCASVGPSDITRGKFLQAATNQISNSEWTLATDGAQAIDWAATTGVGSVYSIYAVGYYFKP